MPAHELLFEIGCEEIPAGFLSRALGELPKLVTDALAGARLTHGTVTVLGTPRRLTVHVAALGDRQPDVDETITGPPAKAAFGPDGKPTKAAIGFAQKMGVPVESLTVSEQPGKGGYVSARREVKGVATRELLPALLVALARAIPWKKSMRWASLPEAFVRPVHWLVALYGGEVVPFSVYGADAGRTTRGHRFLAPDMIALDGTLDGYVSKLRAANVLVDPETRRTAVEAELARLKAEGVRVRTDVELVAEVTNLVEYPKAVVGSFDAALLALPSAVIVSSMRAHQRYFACEKADGSLDNKFVTIAGTLVVDPAVVKGGNERVLAARLADAKFFYDEDKKVGLAAMAPKLDGVVFQAKLGTIGEKVRRIETAATALAGELGVDAQDLIAAAKLAKCDLVSKMVGEFPDLQGLVGRDYAKAAGTPAALADAIFEHYQPRGAGDGLPPGALGAALGLCDRMDTIVGCFAAGLAPTGSADAFGLRRAALGVLRVLVARGWTVPLSRLVDVATGALEGKIKVEAKLRSEILDFFRGRLEGMLAEKQPADCVAAAIAAGSDNVPDTAARAAALAQFRQRPDFEPLAVAFKRVANILKGSGASREPDGKLIAAGVESTLWTAFGETRQRASVAFDRGAYLDGLAELATLRPAIDAYFDGVMIMDKDPAVQAHRLALLGTINAAFLRVADFRQLAVTAG